ncbi:hypothetical protein [Saccharothrix sp. HUAS TT1]|uniref:hypothetical protein n=1 Tax=unclassified Saccharothrix TaxID=2593673 RepID=UPI00345C1A48
MTESPKDWRGTPIEVGSAVLYATSPGRATAIVEGVVSGFHPSGLVKVDVIRRSRYGGSKPTVDVGTTSLTVVSALPASDVPTQAEANESTRVKLLASYERDLANLRAGEVEGQPSWYTEEYLLRQIARYS